MQTTRFSAMHYTTSLVDDLGVFNISSPSSSKGIETMNSTSPTNATSSTPELVAESLFAYPLAIAVTVCVFTSTVTFITLLGNLMVLLAFYLERPLRHNHSNYLVVSMAVCDFLIGATCQMQWTLAALMGYWTFGWLYCQMWYISSVSLCMITQTNAFFIALDRYLGIKYPTRYRAWRTRFKVLLCIFCIWAVSLAVSFSVYKFWTVDASPDFTIDRPSCMLLMDKIPYLLIYTLTFFVRLAIMAYFYSHLYVVASTVNLRPAGVNRKWLSIPKLVSHPSLATTTEASASVLTPTSHEQGNDQNQNFVWTHFQDRSCSGTDGLRGYGNSHTFGRRPCTCLRFDKFNVYNINNDTPRSIGGLKSDFTGNGDNICIYGNRDRIELCMVGAQHRTRKEELTNTNSNSSKASSFNTTSTPPVLPHRGSCVDPKMKRAGTRRIVAEFHLEDNKIVKYPERDEIPEAIPEELSSHSSPTAGSNVAVVAQIQRPTERRNSDRRMLKASRTISFILATVILFFGPFSCVAIVLAFLDREWPLKLFQILLWVMYFNSMFNPMMYAYANPLFRATFHRIVWLHWHRNRSAVDTLKKRKEKIRRYSYQPTGV